MPKKNNAENGPTLHEPVMVTEVLDYLNPERAKGGTFIDATTSTGGHATEIARRLGHDGKLIGLDLDERALEIAKDRLAELSPAVKLFKANYGDMRAVLETEGDRGADGILIDLGFSSFQIDDPSRGFSFMKDGPLDMRMSRDGDLTAEKIVNESPFEELKRIISRYGEERWADGIAREIEDRRRKKRITTTGELVEAIEAALPEGEKARRGNHPATKTFQALRIAVNDELTNIDRGLEAAFDCLKPGGIMVVISYHSLEDRKVKRFFSHKEKECICPPDLPICRCDKQSEAEILTKGAVRPSEEEVENNPRARSARLRSAKKIAELPDSSSRTAIT